ncbi:MAG: S26 family signal peptidase [Bacilli bacterium]|nr:S26 family signal peptidase [Bacilli bacterium]
MKKIIKIISYIFLGIILAFAIAFIVSGTLSIKNNTLIKIFGKSYSIVETDSMEPQIDIGEIIIVEDISYQEVLAMLENNEQPIIVFINSNGLKIVHRAIDQDNEGIITKGDNPEITSNDPGRVTEANLLGIVVNQTKALGIGKFIVNSRSLIFLIAIVMLIIVLVLEVINIIKQLKVKKEEELTKKFEIEKEKLIEEKRQLIKKEIEEELRESGKKE